MGPHELTIVISGPAGSGKTTLAHLISDLLRNCGLFTTVQDGGDKLVAALHAHLQMLRQRPTVIEIRTLTTNKSPSKNV